MNIKPIGKLVFVWVMIIIFTSCQNTKNIKNKQNNTSSTVINSGNNINSEEFKYPLFISFYSIGEGINVDALIKFESFLNEFLQKNHLESIGEEKFNWGREGEIDYCISFKNINQLTIVEFINQTKTLLSGKQNVIIKEQAECVHKR